MGAICGLIDFAAAPPLADLERMAGAMTSYGRDGVTKAARENAAFAFLLTRNVPEDAFEAQPCSLPDGRLFVTWARLHNRAELLAKLGLSAAEGRETADGGLLRMAFERWGEACLEHLVGQFSLAVWDPAGRTLLLACDHMGETSLYVTRRGTRFAFATHPAALFALPDCPRALDEAAFADFRSDPEVTARLNVDAMERLWRQLLDERGDGNDWQPRKRQPGPVPSPTFPYGAQCR